MILKKNLLKNRWSDQQKAEDEARKARKQKLAQQNAPKQNPKKASEDRYKGNVVPIQRGEQYKQSKASNTFTGRERQKAYAKPDSRESSQKSKKSKPKKKNFLYATSEKFRNIKSKPDYMLLQITLILLAVGLVMVLSASSYEGLVDPNKQSGLFFFKRQLFFAVLGLAGMVIMMVMSNEVVRRLSFVGLLLFGVLIIAAMFVSKGAYGAQRWINVAGISFNPSDFAKPFAVVVFASFLENMHNRLDQLSVYMKALVIMIIMPGVVSVEDLGTAIVFFGGLFAMLIVAGAPYRFIFPTIGIGFLAFVAAVISKPYRLQRLTSFINPFNEDLSDTGSYQLQQSLYAFGDGGLFGVGLGNGGQKMSHLFASHTDFIYSIIGEELGFIGAFCVLALFVAFTWRGFWISMRIRDFHRSITAFGLTAFIGGQALINMGVAIGVLPVTGITLPFVSYGGSSLLISLAMVGYILNLSRYMDRSQRKL